MFWQGYEQTFFQLNKNIVQKLMFSKRNIIFPIY